METQARVPDDLGLVVCELASVLDWMRQNDDRYAPMLVGTDTSLGPGRGHCGGA